MVSPPQHSLEQELLSCSQGPASAAQLTPTRAELLAPGYNWSCNLPSSEQHLETPQAAGELAMMSSSSSQRGTSD